MAKRKPKYAYFLVRQTWDADQIRARGLIEVDDVDYLVTAWRRARVDPIYELVNLTVDGVPATITAERTGQDDTHTHYQLTIGSRQTGWETVTTRVSNAALSRSYLQSYQMRVEELGSES